MRTIIFTITLFASAAFAQEPTSINRSGGSTPAPASDSWFDYPYQWCEKDQAATTGIKCNLAQPTPGGSGSNGNDADRKYFCSVSSATAGQIAGVHSPNGWTEPRYRPKIRIWMKTGDVLTATEMHTGLSAATLFGLTGGTAGAATSATFATVFSVNGGNWHCCAADAAAYSCTDTGIAVAVSTPYKIEVDIRRTNASAVTCTINGASTTHTTNVPALTSTAALGGLNYVETTEAVAKTICTGRWVVDQVDAG